MKVGAPLLIFTALFSAGVHASVVVGGREPFYPNQLDRELALQGRGLIDSLVLVCGTVVSIAPDSLVLHRSTFPVLRVSASVVDASAPLGTDLTLVSNMVVGTDGTSPFAVASSGPPRPVFKTGEHFVGLFQPYTSKPPLLNAGADALLYEPRWLAFLEHRPDIRDQLVLYQTALSIDYDSLQTLDQSLLKDQDLSWAVQKTLAPLEVTLSELWEHACEQLGDACSNSGH